MKAFGGRSVRSEQGLSSASDSGPTYLDYSVFFPEVRQWQVRGRRPRRERKEGICVGCRVPVSDLEIHMIKFPAGVFLPTG